MAIPTSGQLSILKMAREAKHADYNGSQSMGLISLYDLVNGGQTGGSTVSYPTVNTGCTPNPADRGTYNSFTIYSNTVGATITLYTTVALTSIGVGTIIYSSVSGQVYTGGGGFIHGPNNVEFVSCGGTLAQGACPRIVTNTTTGAVTSTSCDCP
jgi:hypothetical protein